MIRTLFLDADGVVQRTEPGWRDALGALCGKPDRADEFLADVFAAERPCLAGSGDFERALAEVLGRWQSESSIAEALKVWEMIDPARDVLELVGDIRSRGTQVALATNQQPIRARYMTEVLGYAELFDALLYSCELGAVKPAGDYFRAACRRMRIQDPQEVLFIDDHESNVRAARDAGLRAEIFDLSRGVGELQRILAGYRLEGMEAPR